MWLYVTSTWLLLLLGSTRPGREAAVKLAWQRQLQLAGSGMTLFTCSLLLHLNLSIPQHLNHPKAIALS